MRTPAVHVATPCSPSQTVGKQDVLHRAPMAAVCSLEKDDVLEQLWS
ncbi:hypothetical protein [Streptomyces sp. NPDC097981]